MDHPELFSRWFRGDSWKPWKVFLATLFALPMSPEQLEFFTSCTGRTKPPEAPFVEAWAICGRRAGKSAILAFIAIYLACFRDYGPYLAPGERATIRVMASDRDQARTIFRYLTAMLREIPLLEKLVIKETAESFELSNRVVIECGTANFRAVRGYTYAAVLLDEIAFLRSEDSANPDTEILNAIRPGMATIPGAMLVCASSPYARKGELWKAFHNWWGRDDAPALVWKAATRRMNETVEQAFIDEETRKDPAHAAAEYGAQFRTDVEQFISIEALSACVDDGCFERPCEYKYRYYAFVDPSGGSSDAMTLGIAHKVGDSVFLDLVRERQPPFSPEAIVEEFAGILKQYRITKVFGDRYGGEWPRERFRIHGINYEVSENTKSELYQALLPIINSGAVRLLDNERLQRQLISLERRTSRAGKDSIDHPRGLHDDVSNAVCGAVLLAHSKPTTWNRPREEFRIVEREQTPSYGGDGTGWMAGPIRKWPRSAGEGSGGGWMGR